MSHREPFFTLRIFVPKSHIESLFVTAKKSFSRFHDFECRVRRTILHGGHNDILKFEILTQDPSRLLSGVQKVTEYILFITRILRAIENKSITNFSITPSGIDEYSIIIDQHDPITMKQFRETIFMEQSTKRIVN